MFMKRRCRLSLKTMIIGVLLFLSLFLLLRSPDLEPEIRPLDQGPYLTIDVKEPPTEGVVLLEGYGSAHLTPRMWCALESSASAHRNSTVSLLMTSTVIKDTPLLHALRKELPNLQFLHLNTAHLFQDTILERWYKQRMWERSYWPKSHFNDVLRWLILYQYGGIYLDLDVVVLRSLSSLPNCTGLESERWAAAGALKFTPEHPLIEECIMRIADHFDGTVWGANGPELLTGVLKDNCGMELPSGITPKCPDIAVLPPKAFYPIPWWNWKQYVTENEALSRDLMNDEEVYVLHVWNLHTRHERVRLNSSQPYAVAARERCPTTVSHQGAYM